MLSAWARSPTKREGECRSRRRAAETSCLTALRLRVFAEAEPARTCRHHGSLAGQHRRGLSRDASQVSLSGWCGGAGQRPEPPPPPELVLPPPALLRLPAGPPPPSPCAKLAPARPRDRAAVRMSVIKRMTRAYDGVGSGIPALSAECSLVRGNPILALGTESPPWRLPGGPSTLSRSRIVLLRHG